MNLLIATLCDAATEYIGKLNILGTFDTIYSVGFPVQHPSCSIALRMVFNKLEEGSHTVRVELVNADGKPVGPEMEMPVEIEVPDEVESISRNLIINVQRWQFEEPGQYAVNVAVDGRHEASIPLRVSQIVDEADLDDMDEENEDEVEEDLADGELDEDDMDDDLDDEDDLADDKR